MKKKRKKENIKGNNNQINKTNTNIKGRKKFKKLKNKETQLVILSNNCDGIKHKIGSLKSELTETKATIFTLQETQLPRKGRVKIDGFHVFEAIRNKEGGGLMLGVHESLKPVLVAEYSEHFELIVVEVKVNRTEIRVITGYGPQESWSVTERMPFFAALEEEITKAEMNNKSVILQMDANCKLGPEIIKGDPHGQSGNGKVLAGILRRHALCVINGLEDICVGKITRKRITQVGTEESIIDFVITSNDLVDEVENVCIDEAKDHALEKVTKSKGKVETRNSDHNVIITKFKLKWKMVPHHKEEVFNLANKECQEHFKYQTTETKKLSEVFDENNDINKCTKKFLNRLKNVVHKCFKKVKITQKPNAEYESLYKRWKQLKNKTDLNSIREAFEVENELADKCGNAMYDQIKHEVGDINCEDGGINSGHLWRLKNKLNNKYVEPPTALVDDEGNLVTSHEKIKELNVKHYKEVLRNRDISDDLMDHRTEREKLANLRMKITRENKTPEWTMEDLELVLKKLKRKKSRDAMGYANELFRPEVAGDDLKAAILKMMNRIKKEQIFPESLELCNITSIFKNKGNRNNLDNYRGIFRVTIFRNILERLIYNDEYSNIDANLTDCNVGARKGRNIRDNLFVVNSIINSVKNGKKDPIDVGIYDVTKCFDSLWMHECINDLYEAGLKNDKLNLIYLMNQKAQVSIKTACGNTDRVNIENIVMQGTTWGSLLCTTTMDKLGKRIYENDELLYKYNGEVDIPTLEMVDDILTISKCSKESVMVNSEVNSFIEAKKLTLGATKCAKIHIGKKCEDCAQLFVHSGVMKESQDEKYLGDRINISGKPKATIEERKRKGFAIASQILAMLKELPLGRKRVEIGLILRQAWMINGLLFNSEVWNNLTKNSVKELEIVDHYLLRAILGAHAKVPIEHMFLETGCLPIPYVISVRRLCYLQTILKRHTSEVTRRVYDSQRENPHPGEWCELVDRDKKMINLHLSDNEIANMDCLGFKKLVKRSVRNAAFKDLETLKESHEKVKKNKYNNLNKPQEYISSNLFNNTEVSLLCALRSRTVRGIRDNFPYLVYGGDASCPVCAIHQDTQEHVLECSDIKAKVQPRPHVKYDQIFGNVGEQMELINIYIECLRVREELVGDQEDVHPSLPGLGTGPRHPHTRGGQ